MTPTRVDPGCVATRAVFTTAAGEDQDDEHEHHDESYDAKHLHPAWRAADRFTVVRRAGVVVGAARISHAVEVYETVCRCQISSSLYRTSRIVR